VTQAYIFDHTALALFGAGHRTLSQMAQAAHAEEGRYLYVPALCLTAAVAGRAGLGDHIGSLPALEVVDLDYPGAVAVGHLVGAGMDWRAAHALHVGLPDAEWPTGRPVVTGAPETYDGCGVAVIAVSGWQN